MLKYLILLITITLSVVYLSATKAADINWASAWFTDNSTLIAIVCWEVASDRTGNNKQYTYKQGNKTLIIYYQKCRII